MEWKLVITTDEHGRPRIDEATVLPENAIMTIMGAESADEDPWTHLIFCNDVIIDTGAVTGVRVGDSHTVS